MPDTRFPEAVIMRSAVPRKLATLFVAMAAAALLLFIPRGAQAAGEGAGTGVARVSLIAGDVAIQRGDSSAPVAAALNAPLLGADYVKTGDDSRAEIEFDGTSMVRLGSGVQMRFTHLDAGDRAVQLAQGTIELRLLQAADGNVTVDTPSLSVRAHTSGIYRVTVTDDGQTLVTVRGGEAEIVTPQQDRTLGPGTTLTADGAATDPTLQSTGAIAYDDFDAFNKERDDRHERALADASAYANPTLDGIDALDGYGRWVSDGAYGPVWSPFAAGPGWAPYRNGRWVWEDRYGWTWLASEPWGWAPYHYGRWYRSPVYGWCWYPPQRVELVPAWQPGVVAFFTFGGGNIGWVPLAPYEPFFPWWGYGYGPTPYVINVINVTNVYGPASNVNGEIKRFYRNAPYGTVQPGSRFLLGKFDHPLRVQPAQLARAQFVKGTLPAVPTTANLRFTDAPVARKLSFTPLSRPLFAGDTNVARRMPFQQQRTSLANALRLPAAQTPAQRAELPAPRAASLPAKRVTSPWDRFGSAPVPVLNLGAARSGGAAAATRPAPVTHPASTTPSAAAAHNAQSVTDPWSRFIPRGGAEHASAHPVSSPIQRRDIESVRERPITVPAERAAPNQRHSQVERSVQAPAREAAPRTVSVPAPRTVGVPAPVTAPQPVNNNATQPHAVNNVPGHT